MRSPSPPPAVPLPGTPFLAFAVLRPHQKEALRPVLAFRRALDTLADDPRLSDESRGAILAVLGQSLQEAFPENGASGPGPGSCPEGVWQAFTGLRQVLKAASLPLHPMRQMLEAAEMEARRKPVLDRADLLLRCRFRSAPCGRMFMMLCGFHDPHLLHRAEQVAMALDMPGLPRVLWPKGWQADSVKGPPLQRLGEQGLALLRGLGPLSRGLRDWRMWLAAFLLQREMAGRLRRLMRAPSR